MEQNIEKKRRKKRGEGEYQLYLSGGKLSYKKAILAKCYECMNRYVDGLCDCGIRTCPLYPFMPYNPGRRKGRKISDERKQELINHINTVRQKIVGSGGKNEDNNYT